MAGRLLCSPLIRRDTTDGGSHRIRVAVTDAASNPVKRRVHLFDIASSRLLRETWTNASGSASFDRIAYRYQGYTVALYNNVTDAGAPEYPAIADFVTPEAMP
jgi:hypothetical protein